MYIAVTKIYRFDMKNDKLVVLIKDQKTKKGFINLHDPRNGQEIGTKKEYNFSSDQNSLFELTSDGKKLLTYYDGEHKTLNVCSFDVSNFECLCSKFGKNYKKSIGAISPKDKLLALNLGDYNYQISIINIQNKPILQTFIPSEKESMAIKFIDNQNLFVIENKKIIKKYKLETQNK